MTGLSSINCTQCGAGLSVLGGGRVLSHVCGYCGAVLDAQDNYKVLSSIGERDHPDSPLTIGAEFTVHGAQFVVIGTLGIISEWVGGRARWVEHQLFSKTHGYAWAAWEDGHLTFTRKVRDIPYPTWISTAEVERAETPPFAQLARQRFKYYESGTSRIDFMEGEFNWRPEIGEDSDYVSLMSDNKMLSYSRSGPEREIELTELLDRDAVFAQTGADAPPPSGRHPLAPYVPWADEGFILKACGAFAAIAIVMALVVAGLGGDQVLRQGVTVRQLPASYEFELTNASRLVEVRLQSDVLNAYALFSAEVTGPNGEPVAIGARVTERYSGVEGGERWTEGSGRSSFRFRPETTGLHRITVDYEDGEGWRGNVQEATNLNVDIRQGVGSMIYLVGLAIIFAIGAAITVGRRALFQRLRWAGSDWSDD